MGQDYTEEMVAAQGGGMMDTLEDNAWSLFKAGSVTLMDRQNSSTPLVSPDVFITSRGHGSGRRELAPPSLQCGFCWYKNMSLFRHKSTTVAPHVVTECEATKERLVALCSNRDGQLEELCESVLGNSYTEPV